MQDLDHSKLGDRTGPWSEDRPKAEMLSDYANFDQKSLTMLEVSSNLPIPQFKALLISRCCSGDRKAFSLGYLVVAEDRVVH